MPRHVIGFAAGDRRHEIVVYSEITDAEAVDLLLTALRGTVVR